MLASEEVYLLDVTNVPLKVIPSLENMTFALRPETPQSFTINLDFAESDFAPLLLNSMADDGGNLSIFTLQFSKQFT